MKVGNMKIGNGMLLGLVVIAAVLFYNRNKLFGLGKPPSGPIVMEPGAIDYPELVPSNTVPNQIRTSIQSQLIDCLTANENDPRAQPNCIQYARRAYANLARAYATEVGEATMPPTTPVVPETQTQTRTWDRDRDGGGERDEDKERGSHHHHERHHKRPHKWSRDRRWWWSDRHRRWRRREERDDDEDDHRGGHDRWGRPKRKGWRRNRCHEEFHGRCDSECDHGPSGRCINCIHACGSNFPFWRPSKCWRFWWWHFGPCGPVGFPWWKPKWHRHHHYWSHDRRRWWDDRGHRWRDHREHDRHGGGRERANLRTAQNYGLTYYEKDYGLDYMRGR